VCTLSISSLLSFPYIEEKYKEEEEERTHTDKKVIQAGRSTRRPTEEEGE
jgi:hypothetical protein